MRLRNDVTPINQRFEETICADWWNEPLIPGTLRRLRVDFCIRKVEDSFVETKLVLQRGDRDALHCSSALDSQAGNNACRLSDDHVLRLHSHGGVRYVR